MTTYIVIIVGTLLGGVTLIIILFCVLMVRSVIIEKCVLRRRQKHERPVHGIRKKIKEMKVGFASSSSMTLNYDTCAICLQESKTDYIKTKCTHTFH